MAVKKIPCGGFYYDDETVSFDDDVMTVVGGGNVPDPEVADIGKVLGIVEDGAGAKYAPVECSGGGDDFVVTFTISQSGVTADKTLSEISTALMNGMPVKGIYNNAVTYYSINSNAFVFSEIVQSENMIYAQVIELSGENWTYGEFAYTLTPAT